MAESIPWDEIEDDGWPPERKAKTSWRRLFGRRRPTPEVAPDAVPERPHARGNEKGRCYWCDGTTVICFTCKMPRHGEDDGYYASHEPRMVPCRECNGGSYPVQPPERWHPCADCLAPGLCAEASAGSLCP